MAKYNIELEVDFDDEELDDDDIVAERARVKEYLESDLLAPFAVLNYGDDASETVTVQSVTVVDQED